MKIKYILPLSLVVATAIGGINFTHAAQRINVESDVYSQIAEDLSNKSIWVDTRVFLTRLNFKIPDSAQSGDFFEVDMNGVAEIPKGHKFIDARGVEVATVSEKTCVRNSQNMQFASISDNDFNSLKLEDGPGKCKYKITLRNIDNATNTSISFESRKSDIHFAIANQNYNYNAYIKVNDELKWSDTYVVKGFSKSPKITHYGMFHAETSFVNGNQDGVGGLGFETPDYLIGKSIEISLDKDAPITFIEDRDGIDNIGHNFYFGDDNRVNPEGIVGNPSLSRKMKIRYDEKGSHKVAIGIESQSTKTYSRGVDFKVRLNPDVISKMNLKDGYKIPVVYKAKIKDADGSILYEKDLSATITFVGSHSIADLIRLQPPKPAEEIPAQPKEKPQPQQPQIQTPNTGLATPQTFLLPLFGILTAATYMFIRKK